MSIPPDMSPTRPELLDEIRRLVYVVADVPPVNVTVTWGQGGPVITRDRPEPHLSEVASAEWWEASDRLKAAALLVLAEAWLVHDPDRAVRERLRAMSWDLAEAMRGRHGGPSHSEFERRRAAPGPAARQIDPAAVQRWVATGSSDGDEGVPAA